MKRLVAQILIAAMLSIGVLASIGFAAQKLDPAIEKALASLNWSFGPTTIAVGPLHGELSIRSDEALVQGKDAIKFLRLSQGFSDVAADAVLFTVKGRDIDTMVVYKFGETGHLKVDDWTREVRSKQLLSRMKENDDQENKGRAPGYQNYYVDGWIEEPYFDRENGIAFWAVKLRSEEGEEIVNAEAIKLTRNGFTQLIWTGPAEKFLSTQQNLIPALRAYKIDEGQRYADFEPGVDKVAKVGLGAIVGELLAGSDSSD